jgi:hypothetical protein
MESEQPTASDGAEHPAERDAIIHEYHEDITVQGYRTDSCTGAQYSLDTVFARTQGNEFCDVGYQIDFDKTQNSPAGVYPWTLSGVGGYASSGCLLGHYLLAFPEAGARDAATDLHYRLDGEGWFAIPPGNGAIAGGTHCLDLWIPPGMDDPCTIWNSGPGYP